MAALPRWMYGDPADVLDRKRGMEQRRVEKSPEGRAQRAKEGLAELFGVHMTIDESEQIEALLVIWYKYECKYMPHLGAPRISPSCRGHSSGDIHMVAEDRDDMLEQIKAREVAACLDEIHYMHRAAIGVHVKNKVAGASEHRNGRTPIEHKMYQEAKTALLPGMRRRGLIKC